jgi:glycosyltransferase involved in cell wall biosynthesis
MNTIPFKVGVQQRVLPAYRVPFFDLLASTCEGGLSVFAGLPRPEEALGTLGDLQVARQFSAENMHLGYGRLYACVQRNLIEWLEGWQPDVLIVEANPRYLKTPAAVRWMKNRRKPVIGWGLGNPPVQSFWRSMLRERFLAGLDAILTYSQLGASQYRDAGFPAERIFVAPNAVAPRPAHPLPEREPDFPSGRAQLLFVGRLQARKRIELLIRTCAGLAPALQPELTIVGEGPARKELEALAAELYPRTQFVGEKQGEELEAYYRAADLFVLPGTGGLAVQQAMGWGLPVVVAEADGTQADLVRSGNGWLIPPGNMEALRDCLAAALADPVRLRTMGCESYRIVKDEINLEAMVGVFARAIQATNRGS